MEVHPRAQLHQRKPSALPELGNDKNNVALVRVQRVRVIPARWDFFQTLLLFLFG